MVTAVPLTCHRGMCCKTSLQILLTVMILGIFINKKPLCSLRRTERGKWLTTIANAVKKFVFKEHHGDDGSLDVNEMDEDYDPLTY